MNDLKIVINSVQGKVFWSLRRNYIVLFTLFSRFSGANQNLISCLIPLCNVLSWSCLTEFWVKYNGGWSILLICLLKITSGACYLGSGLSFTFRWKPQSLLFVKSLFKSHAAEFMSSTTEKESCHLRIVLNLQLNHQTSHWYRSEKIMVQEKILGDPYFNISPWRVLSI